MYIFFILNQKLYFTYIGGYFVDISTHVQFAVDQAK